MHCWRPACCNLLLPEIFLQSPFGAAKPRERVIAERAGKSEEDVLKEEVKKEKIQVSPEPIEHGLDL